LLLLLIVRTALVALAGACLGLLATGSALERGVSFETVEAGPWRAAPRAALVDADPYTRAGRARSGEVPMAPGEGLAFFASVDETGAPLDARCDYAIAGPTPPARFWTLTPLDAKGRLTALPNERPALTSAQIVRDERGRFEIVASRHARAGNWLALPREGAFTLALRLYDTPASAQPASAGRGAMPSLRREGCA